MIGELPRSDPSVCGLILAGVWVMFQVHKCCSLSIIKSRQRRRLFPCCSEPTHVYIPVWSRAYTVCIFLTMERLFVWGVQMVISRGWDRIWLSFEDTSGRSIDGEADQCLISHPPGWISSWIARTGWLKHSPFGCWAPGSKDLQEAGEKRSREEPVSLSAAVRVMHSWFQDSVLLTSKLGPSLIFSGSSLRRGNGEQSWRSKSSVASVTSKGIGAETKGGSVILSAGVGIVVLLV